jgi:hypothetical protein
MRIFTCSNGPHYHFLFANFNMNCFLCWDFLAIGLGVGASRERPPNVEESSFRDLYLNEYPNILLGISTPEEGEEGAIEVEEREILGRGEGARGTTES